MFLGKKFILSIVLMCMLVMWGQKSYAQEEYYYDIYDEIYDEFSENKSSRPYDYKIWARKGKYQQKINEIGFKLLNANKFPRRVNFRLINVKLYNMEAYNAYARYLDGRVGIYSGYLYYFDNDDELAAVLAHELGHIKQLSTGFWPWKRIKMFVAPKRYEYDADIKGIDYMVKAGYNPLAMITFYNKITHEKSAYHKFIMFMKELSFLFLLPIDTHPTGSKRIQNIYNHIQTHYPGFLSENKNNLYYINFLINHEKNDDLRGIKEKYNINVPIECENL